MEKVKVLGIGIVMKSKKLGKLIGCGILSIGWYFEKNGK